MNLKLNTYFDGVYKKIAKHTAMRFNMIKYKKNIFNLNYTFQVCIILFKYTLKVRDSFFRRNFRLRSDLTKLLSEAV